LAVRATRKLEAGPRRFAASAVSLSMEGEVGGFGVSEAQKLKTREDENRRLKKPLAAPMLDVAALKDVLGKTGIAGADYQNSFVISSACLRC
jgi:hypothetical protein